MNHVTGEVSTQWGTPVLMRPDNPDPTPRSASTLSAHLFGKFRIDSGAKSSRGMRSSKVQELFCYLVLHRQRMHNREFLANVLWDGMSSSQSRKQLRHTLWQLHVLLEPGKRSGDDRQTDLLIVEPNWVQFNAAATIWVDVIAFEEAFRAVKGIPASDVGDVGARTLADAVNLSQGDLLEGWYQDWCLRERERLQNMRLLAMDKLMDHLTLKQEYESAIAYGEDVLRVERARECTHHRLMRLRYLVGDRVAALRQYQVCAAALDDELGVPPARTTLELRNQIEADQMEVAPPPSATPLLAPHDALQSVTQVLMRLNQLNAVLVDVQRQVEQDLGFIERSLNGHARH
jgi:DNA-binding SARP family transcriptional activator